ncbi:MAG: hypothetical protein CVT77_06555 [Alphaproteobacteria bacterium HGW-Alphaproteobacteria-16]|nr:MAG: hypothetical protein CVT77_06555 [Alphaproteobacteria bacterium HGW-Alphaproteobacteria-16]
MTATTTDRNTGRRDGVQYVRKLAAAKVLAGTIACLNAAGYAVGGSTATTLVADGVFFETVDNSGGAAGDKSARVEKGVFHFLNSASTDAITIAEVGDDCYIVDNQTVAKTDGTSTRSKAGKIVDVDAQGVWVEFR